MERFISFFEKMKTDLQKNGEEVSRITKAFATTLDLIRRVEIRLDEMDKFFEFLKKFFPPDIR
jgi:hypothetical protein